MSEYPAKDKIFISKLIEIIRANLGNENFGVNELVHETGISHYSLKRRLQAITNKSIKQFIREVRLQKAFEMLQNEEVHASEVAYRVGFGSPAYFNTCFHDFYGFSPGAVRKGDFTISKETDSDDEGNKLKRNFRSVLVFIPAGILGVMVITFLVDKIFLINSPDNADFSLNIGQQSLAVLPFNNLGEDITDQYVYDGIMEEIYNSLTKVKELRVIARTSAEQFRNPKSTLSEIGKKLGVDYIVEGSGQKFGKTFRLRVQLIEVANDRHIWAGSYQRPMKRTKKFFRIQSQIAQNIASELKANITLEEKEIIEKVPTAEITAYSFYLKANDYQKDYEKTHELSSYHTSVNLYKDALTTDSVFARAYTGLANVYYTRYRWESYFREDYLDSMLVLLNRAVLIDNQLDEAYYLRGLYYLENENIDYALDDFDRVLQINPNFYMVYIRKAYILRSRKQDIVSALENFHKAFPFYRGTDLPELLRELAFTYQVAGFVDEADKYLQQAFELDGDSIKHLYRLSWSELSRENFGEVIKLIERAYEIDPEYLPGLPFISYNLQGYDNEAFLIAGQLADYYKKSGELNLYLSHYIGYAFWKSGKYKEATEFFNQQIKYGEESIELNRDYAGNGLAYFDLAATYAFLNDKEKTWLFMDYAYKLNFCPLWVLIIARNHPLFNSIRDEERNKKILQHLESIYQAEHERVKIWLGEQERL